MKSIPKPLFKRLVLTIMVGTGCFFTGLIFSYHDNDISFLIMSSLILLFSFINAFILFIRIKRKSYAILEGICTDVSRKLFSRCFQVLLTDSEGEPHHLLIAKDYKIRTGFSYRFYFRSSSMRSIGQNPIVEKAMLTDNLLGVEIIDESSNQNVIQK